MNQTKHNSPLSLAYANSLLDLATEQNQAEAIGTELGLIRQVIQENRSFKLFLLDPGISQVERGGMMKRVFGNNLSPLMHNFTGVLNAKNRLSSIGEIADAYDALLDEKFGKIEVDVTVAQKLSPEELEEVRKKVSAALKKDAVVHQYVDESIIGGLILRVQDKLIDSSVKSQLAAMKEQLLATTRK
jgi:F-type H+-transporting ATPase subunit delta